MYTREEFHNNVLPRAADNQPPRILNELRQLSCRLVASGIAKGLLKTDDLPEIRKTLVSRFEVLVLRSLCVLGVRTYVRTRVVVAGPLVYGFVVAERFFLPRCLLSLCCVCVCIMSWIILLL